MRCGRGVARPLSTTVSRPQSRSVTAKATSTRSTSQPRTPAPCHRAGAATGTAVGPGTGCNQPTSDVGTVLNGNQGYEVPGSPPIDSTASVNPSNGNLLFDAGNAAEPADGGYYEYSPTGAEVWNQVVTNPATDTCPTAGCRRHPPSEMRVPLRSRLSRASDVRAQHCQRVSGVGMATVLRRQHFLHRGVGRPLQHRAARLRRRWCLVPEASPTGPLRERRARAGSTTTTVALVCRQHDGGSRLVAGRRPDPGGRRPTGSRPAPAATIARAPSDENTVKVYDTKCNQVWSDSAGRLRPGAAPRWPTSQGNGQLAVVEGTDHGRQIGHRCGR